MLGSASYRLLQRAYPSKKLPAVAAVSAVINPFGLADMAGMVVVGVVRVRSSVPHKPLPPVLLGQLQKNIETISSFFI